MQRLIGIVLALSLLAFTAVTASAHSERTAANPPNNDATPIPAHRDVNPADPKLIVVCKPNSPDIINAWPAAWNYLKTKDMALMAKCGYNHLQAAVNAVQQRGTTIAVLPGTYLEEPSLDTTNWSQKCKDLLANVSANPKLSYADQLECPNVTQEVAILGDPDSVSKGLVDGDANYDCDGRLCDLQVEGMGREPTEVNFDNQFHRLNAIRADRAYGFYIRNLTVQDTEFNGLYVIEVDGYVIDSILARWDLEYGFLTFTVDHGLWKNCETYGNGDSGLYPGGQAQRYGFRPSTEVTGCSSHHNAGGTSGTAGDSVYFHDNWMYDNVTGIANDSFAANHPGTPQNSGLYVRNHVFSNNENFYYYAQTTDPNDPQHRTYCGRPTAEIDYAHGVVCPSFVFPVGVGIMAAGGNFNVYAENWIADNWRTGTLLFTVPAALHGDQDPNHLLDNSHGNRYYANRMGFDPTLTVGGTTHPNGLDFYWDQSGVVNCWQENIPAPGHQIYSDPPYNTAPNLGGRPTGSPGSTPLPLCFPMSQPTTNQAPSPAKAAFYLGCSQYDLHGQPNPPDCNWDKQIGPPADNVSTGFGVLPGQQVLAADKAPSGWSLGWVNPPAGAAADKPGLLPNNLPIVGSLPNTSAQVPLILLLGLALFAAGLRVGRAWRRRMASPPGSEG